MALPQNGTDNSVLMRHPDRRISPMLQWNSKTAVFVIVALLIALSAFLGSVHLHALNIIW